jgi:Ca2+-binding RTX toxin-like protein
MVVGPIKGTTGNDVRNGTSGDDIFVLSQGGDDTAFGDDGADVFKMKGALGALDAIDGGSGADRMILKGDYSAGLVFGAATMTNIEVLRLAGNFTYDLTTHDATVAGGERLAVNAGPIGGGQSLTFNGSAELDGAFDIYASAGNDTLTGGAQGDAFYLARGGNDTAYGGGGNDTFHLGATLTAADTLDGGADDDTVQLSGSGYDAFTFGATTMVNVETLLLSGSGSDFRLTTGDATVAAGAVLIIDGSALSSSDDYNIDGSAETDGSFNVIGSEASNLFTGGDLADVFDGAGGADSITGGAGADDITVGADADTLIVSDVTESNSAGYDVIHGFDAGADKFDLGVGVGSVSTASGSISAATFDADMGTVISDQICAVVTATGGDLIGHVFLYVDGIGGGGGYQAGQDYIFDITGYTGTLDTGDFI